MMLQQLPKQQETSNTQGYMSQADQTTHSQLSHQSAVHPPTASPVNTVPTDVHFFRLVVRLSPLFCIAGVVYGIWASWLVPTLSVGLQALGFVLFLLYLLPTMRHQAPQAVGDNAWYALPSHKRPLAFVAAFVLFGISQLLPAPATPQWLRPNPAFSLLFFFAAASQLVFAVWQWPRNSSKR